MNKPSSLLCSALWLITVSVSLHAESLWRQDTRRSMFADHRAFEIGDILTVLVQENNTTTKDNNTTTSKASGVDASIATFLYSPTASGFLTHNGQLPAMKYASKSGFDGGGSINNSEKITARIPVRVVDVLPNDNLVVEGKRRTSFAGETQDVVLRGTVRTADITAINTVFSYHVADATIQFASKGCITDTQRKGWFTKIWDVLAPF